jgi:hypothetical protein
MYCTCVWNTRLSISFPIGSFLHPWILKEKTSSPGHWKFSSDMMRHCLSYQTLLPCISEKRDKTQEPRKHFLSIHVACVLAMHQLQNFGHCSFRWSSQISSYPAVFFSHNNQRTVLSATIIQRNEQAVDLRSSTLRCSIVELMTYQS